ncbi:MAG: cache domain-containing protein [Chloroflexota bacterium]
MVKIGNGLLDLASRIRRNVKRSIATRLSLSLFTIIILSGLLFTIVGVQTISTLIINEAQDRVRNDLNAARLIYQNELNHVSQAAEFTASRTFIESVILQENNALEYVDELSRFRVSEDLDILSFTDRNGVVILRTSNPSLKGDDQSRQELIKSVLDTENPTVGTVIISSEALRNESPTLAEQAHFVFVDTPKARSRSETEETAGMILMAATPIFDNNGNFIGVVYAGVLLNRNYNIVDEVKQTVFQGVVYEGRDIGTATIFQDDVRISTNVHNTDGSRAIGTRVSEEVYQQVVVDGEQWIGRAYVVNDWYISAYEPIQDPNDKIIGILYVGILEQKYTDIKNHAILVFSGITLSGVVLSIALALLISRGISSSINKLVSASKQLANGNLEAKVSKVSNDELGELADTFNFMAAALKDRDEKLKEYTKEKIMESERLALVGQLSANVAHELNNPLQGIVTYSYLLLEEGACNENEDVKANLQKIVVQANRCRDIIRGLLDFSRHKNPDKTLCNVNSLLRDCISLVEKQAIFLNIKVVLNLESNLPLVVLDPSQVERVFLNLIINAAEAMDGNGRLILTTRQNRKKKNVEIKVQDTGHGIAAENMKKIFDPFFTTKETGHGVGLGLAISYGIVKEHRGNLTVESELEKGTTFMVSFPQAIPDSEAANGR